jgi:hypothetical protein
VLWIVSDRIAGEGEVKDLPEDGCAGPKLLENVLAHLLGAGTSGTPSATAADTASDPPRHFLYFHDKDLADRAADACRSLGYDPSVVPSVDEEKPWVLLAAHRLRAATDADMERAGEELQEVAQEWGGEYDGWDKSA